MRTVPTIGCAGKEHHDYQFQFVQARGLSTMAPEAIIGMCRNCGDVYTVEVSRPRQIEEREDAPFVRNTTLPAAAPWEGFGATAGQPGGISLNRDRDDGPTNSVPPTRPSNW